jgi:thioredoxin 1
MDVTSKTFEAEVLKSELPVLVDFWASWCVPCKSMEPILAKFEKEFEGQIKICKCNTDKNRSLSGEYNIKGLPTFIFFKNGESIRREVAAKSESELQKIIEEVLQ